LAVRPPVVSRTVPSPAAPGVVAERFMRSC
jgi:hypothetical protein